MLPSDLPAPAGALHRTGTAERGSFAVARCSCGWSGPARRSRERARSDARAHSPEAVPLPEG
ncbi:hypothetical protein [Streptomyces inusitatus]|uniref:hypothetical protein n=1 Tax=Streptomyces inusitatus TaxID=68221 RepID=UPI00167E1A1A|nr:hypothetical protein [Streptomyces inusitatus]